MFIDTHSHLFNEYYDNIDEIINKSKEDGIDKIIVAGVDNNSNHEIFNNLINKEDIYICLGIHPESTDSYKEEDLSFIEENINNPKVVAISEIGLDYHYEDYNKEKQIDLFKKQLHMAEKYHMPVIIHSRDATLDTMNTLKEYNLKGIIHSFSGSYETGCEYIKLGYKLGINGVVTFKNSHLIETVKKLGINNFVLETDSPYLTPEPLRGHQNYPGNIKYIIEYLSNNLDISKEDIINITNNNVYEILSKLNVK